MALIVSYEQHFVSKMIDENWDKLTKKCISIDELMALQQAFDVFQEIDTSKERAVVSARLQELTNDAVLANEAQRLSDEYTEQKLQEEVLHQPDLSIYSEAEEEGVVEGDPEEDIEEDF